MRGKRQAIALCRVSSDEQLKNNSLNRQNKAVQKIAEEYDLEIVRIWSGSASSKHGCNLERKDLQEMFKFCQKNKHVKYLIVDEPDRFMRSMREASWYETEFENKYGVEVLYSDPELNKKNSISRFQRMLCYFSAESSNEERQRKSVKGSTAALLEGRYPFPPPLGYIKGRARAIPEIDPAVGPILRTALLRIAEGLESPTVALQHYNRDIQLAGLQKAMLKMDKFRKAATNPFYCGVVEMHKSVDVRNPNGLHEKLITPAEHDKIVEIFEGKPKNQSGPHSNGNPLYPFNRMLTHADCPLTKTKYNTFVGVTVKNGTGKKYEKYRCRGCGMSIPRNEMREKISDIFESIQLTDSGERALRDALSEAFYNHSSDIEEYRAKLNAQKRNARKEAEKYMEAYVNESDTSMKAHLRERHDELEGRIASYDKELDKLGNYEADASMLFVAFALDFVSDLANKVLELNPEDMQKCKSLLVPNGFCVDNNRNVYTHVFSPIYRWADTKNSPTGPENSLMVRVKRL